MKIYFLLIYFLRSIVFFFFIPGVANAGGLIPHVDSVVFSSGSSVIKPGATVEIRFRVSQYTYGSDEYGYASLGIAPKNVKTDLVRHASANSWLILGILVSSPKHADLRPSDYDEPEYRVSFRAPTKPGHYKILLGGVPKFTAQRRSYNAKIWESFEPSLIDRSDFISALIQYNGMIKDVVDFTVSAAAPAASQSPTVYLRINDKVPPYTEKIGGMQKNPVIFSWKIGPEFQRKHGKIQYRYQLKPYDDHFGVWADDMQVSYAFLQKGINEFQVEARHVNGADTIESQRAIYRFNVPKEHIAQPISKAPIGLEIKPHTVSYDAVYKKSRALLVGMWDFSDA